MKLIITEEQLRLIIENEGGGKLFNIPGEFLRIANGVEKALKIYNDKKGIKGWDGIKIDGYLNLNYFASQGDSINDLLDEIVVMDGVLVLPVGDYKNSFNKLKVIKGDLNATDVWNISLPELEYVNGDLDLKFSGIKKLPKLKEVGGSLHLSLSDIKSLPELKYVGSMLALRGTNIESLPMLEYVDSTLILSNTPLSKTTTEEELRNKINVGGDIFL
jgi:hypothetical protein